MCALCFFFLLYIEQLRLLQQYINTQLLVRYHRVAAGKLHVLTVLTVQSPVHIPSLTLSGPRFFRYRKK